MVKMKLELELEEEGEKGKPEELLEDGVKLKLEEELRIPELELLLEEVVVLVEEEVVVVVVVVVGSRSILSWQRSVPVNIKQANNKAGILPLVEKKDVEKEDNADSKIKKGENFAYYSSKLQLIRSLLAQQRFSRSEPQETA